MIIKKIIDYKDWKFNFDWIEITPYQQTQFIIWAKKHYKAWAEKQYKIWVEKHYNLLIKKNHYDFTNTQYNKVKTICSLLEDVNTVYDIGGNIGMYSTFFKHFLPNAQIYGFEPLPNTFKLAKENTKNTNINWFNLGLWDKEGDVTLNVPKGKNQSTNYGAFWDDIEPNVSQTVNMTTLDKIIDQLGVIPDFIKIDVEGGEYKVLTGGLNNIEKIKYIMVEWRVNPEPVNKLLIEKGFIKLKTIDKFDIIYINTNI